MPNTELGMRRVVLEHGGSVGEGYEVFDFRASSDPAENWTPGISVTLRSSTWADFGQSNQITVTIEPGDKLNDGTHAHWDADVEGA